MTGGVRGVGAVPTTMAGDDTVIRSARNAFMVLLVLLFAVSTYQFYTIGGLTTPIGVLWVAGVGTFYLSKWYYGRQATAGATEQTEKD